MGDPSLAVEEISEEKVVLTAKTPVKPDVAIGKYTGIKIARYEYTVTDADVEKDIEGTRERLAESRDVTDRPAQEKDTVNIDFVGRCEGELFEGGSAKGFDLTLGSGQFIPGFEDQVIGMNVGLNLQRMDSTLNVAAVCEGIRDVFAAKTKEALPSELRERAYFVPCSLYAQKEGYYVLFQDAGTGETVPIRRA